MPKKISPEENYEEEEEQDEEEERYDEEEEDEGDEEEEVRRPGRPRNPVRKPKEKVSKSKVVHAKRYVAFSQPASEGIMDSETREIIAADLWTALADIKSELESIRLAIGVLQ